MFYDEFPELLLMQLLYKTSSASTCVITKVNNRYGMLRTIGLKYGAINLIYQE